MARPGYIGEVMRALAVLALVFFNFGHAPAVAAQAPGWTAIAFDGFCGDLPDGEDRGHAPCHACRIGGSAALPPPAGYLPVVRVAVAPDYSIAIGGPEAGVGQRWPAARGPPVLV